MENEWTLDVENVLCKIRQNAGLLSKYHKKRYYRYKGYLKYFRIPTIVFSAISSVISVGLQPYISQNNVSLITCLISLGVGIINSLELFLTIQTTMENELINSKEFYLLSIDIYKTLLLEPTHRGIGGQAYLDEKYNLYCKLIENSELIKTSIRDKLVYIEVNKKNRNLINITNHPIRPNNNFWSWICCGCDNSYDDDYESDDLISKISRDSNSPENAMNFTHNNLANQSNNKNIFKSPKPIKITTAVFQDNPLPRIFQESKNIEENSNSISQESKNTEENSSAEEHIL